MLDAFSECEEHSRNHYWLE